MGRFSSSARAHARTKKRKLATAAEKEGAPKAQGADGMSEGAEMEIVPIPEEFMSAAPVVSLTTASGRKEKGGVWEVRGGRTQVMKKKDKRKFRHVKWLQKMEGCQLARQLAQAAVERKKTVVVGDMEPLAAALPQLSVLPAPGSTRSKHEKGRSKTPKSKISHRTNLVREVEHFQKVLDHPAFKSDPLDAISQHIRNSLAREGAR